VNRGALAFIGVLAAAGIVVGSLMPWLEVEDELTLYGTDVEGKLTLVLGALTAALYVAWGTGRLGGDLPAEAMVLAAAALLVVLVDAVDRDRFLWFFALRDASLDPAEGIWVTAVSALVALVAPFANVLRIEPERQR
jgi:hypothetical protein